MADADSFFITGGTLPLDAASYVVRSADQELYRSVHEGEFCYILTPRQMGKSSLVARTAQRFHDEGVSVAIVDLTDIGKPRGDAAEEQWYQGIARIIAGELDLGINLKAWWADRSNLSAVQRWTEFIREVILGGTTGRSVIFIDEIDNTLGLSFADDFFAAIRACYNHRASDPRYNDLTFVLVGVATPSVLIADTSRTPFNIGRKIELTDFTAEEARPFAEGLSHDGSDGAAILFQILDWTGGHPYLTQSLCDLVVAEPPGATPGERVDRVVEREFLASGADKEEKNLQFVRNFLTARPERARRLLRLYRRVRRGDRVADDPRSPDHLDLKLSGVVKRDKGGHLIVRNRIYERVFNLDWIKAATPSDPVRIWATRTAVASVLLLVLSPAFWYEVVYPQQFEATLEKTLEDYSVAQSAYTNLHRIPFHGGRADDLWGRFNLRRMDKALDLDALPNRRSDAYSLVNDAQVKLVELKTLPKYAAMGATKRSHFFEQRAIRSAYGEHREDALLWWLEALAALPESEKPRRAASHLIGADYARLEKTIRPRGAPTKSDGNPLEMITTLSPDGQRLAVVNGGNVYLWDVQSPAAEPLHFRTAEDQVYAMAFSRDGRRLAAGSKTNVYIWHVDRSGDKPLVLPLGDTNIRALSFSNDGRRLAAGGGRGVRVWDLDLRDAKPLFLRKPFGSVDKVAISPDGRRVAAAGLQEPNLQEVVWVWDVNRLTTEPLSLRSGQRSIEAALEFSPDGRRLVKAGLEALSVWNMDRPGDEPLSLMYGLTWPKNASIDLDRRWISVGGLSYINRGGAVHLWDSDQPGAGSFEFWMPEHTTSSILKPDGRHLITAGLDRLGEAVVREWNLDRPGDEPGAGRLRSSQVLPFLLSPDGRRVAGVQVNDISPNGQVRALRVSDLDHPDAEPIVFPVNVDVLSACVFSPDGRRLASASKDSVRVWDTSRPGTSPVELRSPARAVELAFSPDGRRLAGGGINFVAIWDMDRSLTEPTVLQSTEPFESVAFSPDGRRLAGGYGNLIRIWDLDHLRASPLELRATSADVHPIGIAFSPDGRQLLASPRTAIDSQGILIWDLTRQVSKSFVLESLERGTGSFEFSPFDDPTYLLIATPTWAHLARLDGTRLVPYASRLLPGDYPVASSAAARFLDPTGKRLQILVLPNRATTWPITLRFDEFDASPIPGEPEQLLIEWQKKLALRISDTGEIINAK